MSENSSSASHEKLMPAGKPSSSFVTDSSKTGMLGDNPISVTEKDGAESTEKAVSSTAFASKGDVSFDGVKEIMPQGKPDSSFINTSAVK